ncbi:MAG: acetolactate decarboxylase [Desulfovibrionaceae bacterium]|jgi:acetolactate decarboxylase|nr:acetolactate decarboxylase [Desulfovibrionaceae bacterium]
MRLLIAVLVALLLSPLAFADNETAVPDTPAAPQAATAQADGTPPVPADKDLLWQVSTIDALLSGVYDGHTTFAELARHGGFGIGTFDALDGEMVATGGKFFQVRADGRASLVDMKQTTPFACVTHFDPEIFIAVDKVESLKDLLARIDPYLPGRNMFYAIKVTGAFDHVKTRSVPRQEKPYPPLAEVTKHQPEFEIENRGGDIVGIFSPPFVKQIGVPGYHLHYITEDRLAGGHLLDVRGHDLVVAVDVTPRFTLVLPDQEQFQKVDYSKDKSEELKKVEK